MVAVVVGGPLPFTSILLTAEISGRVPLPSHRLVGELPHPIELLLHLVCVLRLNVHISNLKLFLRSHPQRANIPGDASQRDAPCSWTAAQHTIRAPIISLPASQAASRRRGPIRRSHISQRCWMLKGDSGLVWLSVSRRCLRRGRGMLERFTAATRRGRSATGREASRGCAARHCGKRSESSASAQGHGGRAT